MLLHLLSGSKSTIQDQWKVSEMSRTFKNEKGAGKEYWSRRAGNKGGACPGRLTKKHTARVERRTAHQELKGTANALRKDNH